ncbi:hypothetical protein [Desulfocicer vacuolatum]|uniref:hypothetical protein n=1 Tax=Desulfocicer vacuolatum TaxID=2298 RepID=UPI001BAE56C7|nr:hypothetical protein [Desulfocicer vacuolatum]
MKYSANLWSVSIFVVGRAGSEYGLPVAIIYNAASKATSAEPSPRRAIGTGQLSCLQFRSGPIARRGDGGIIPFSIFVVGGSRSKQDSLVAVMGR